MTTARGPDHPSNRGGHQSAISYPKALAVLLVGMALGGYLLQLGGGHTTPPAAAGPPPSSSTTTTTTSTTAPSSKSSKPAASRTVTILVANGSQTNGVAGFYTGKLAAAGWGTLTAVSALTAFATSSVWYASGQQSSADAVATELGVPTSAVQPVGPTTPVPGATAADVVVVIGDDLAAKVPTTTTTT